jgi:hypothetical protein
VPPPIPRFLSPSSSPVAEVRFWSVGCGPTFHDSHRFPSCRFHLAVPPVDLSHSLAFGSLSPCEVDDVLWSARYPCWIQAPSAPPGCHPRLLQPIAVLRCRSRFILGQVWLVFPRLSSIPIQSCFSLAGVLTVAVGVATRFSITECRCRPTASLVCMLPLPLEAGQCSPTFRRVPGMTFTFA